MRATKSHAEQDFDRFTARTFNVVSHEDHLGAEEIDNGVMHHAVHLPLINLYLLAFRLTTRDGKQEAWTDSHDRVSQFDELSTAFGQDGPWKTVDFGGHPWTIFICPSD